MIGNLAHEAIRAYMATPGASERWRRYYRKLRAAGWTPPYALRAARLDTALAYAEGIGLIVLDWLYDEDYEVDDCDPYFAEQERTKLASGEWEALGCVARTAGNDHAASLWGIVLGHTEQDGYYRRSVETDLAIEADVIPND